MGRNFEATLVILTGAVIDTPSELMIFSCNEDASKFFDLNENIVTKGLLNKEKAEKLQPI